MNLLSFRGRFLSFCGQFLAHFRFKGSTFLPEPYLRGFSSTDTIIIVYERIYIYLLRNKLDVDLTLTKATH